MIDDHLSPFLYRSHPAELLLSRDLSLYAEILYQKMKLEPESTFIAAADDDANVYQV